MGPVGKLEQGRDAFGRRAWQDAYEQLSGADADAQLGDEDLERLARAAHLVGRDAESEDAWARAYQDLVSRGEPARAARCAFWLGLGLMNRGEMAPAGGWFARGQRLLDDEGLDCAERGYLLVPAAIQSLHSGDPDNAYEMCGIAIDIGARFDEPDLLTLGRLGRGQALITKGEAAEGIALLDEAMVSVTSGEVSEVIAGIVYCAVIAACQEIFDLRRAQEWTTALTRWCGSQPDLVPYRGQCLVHRAEIMQLHGAWRDAMEEARRARQRLSDPPGQPAVGAAFYQLGELHRLRGELDEAEEAYKQASRWGRMSQPGSALLRLARGGVEAAAGAIRRVLEEASDPVTRSKVLPAFVEIVLADGDVDAARAAADELSEMAVRLDAPLLRAVAAHADAAVLLAEGDAGASLGASRTAWEGWREMDAPYEAARSRVLIALACRELGDEDGFEMDLDAAREVFEQLGAAPDLARLDAMRRTREDRASGGLTSREVEILRLVATGRTNRSIAEELVISEKTVARHVSNIFTKLGVPSRAAATAYAYEHDLV